MKKLSCRFMVLDSNLDAGTEILYLPAGAANILGIAEGKQITLECGVRKVSAGLKISSCPEMREGTVYLSCDIMEKLLIPEGISAELFSTGQTFRIGPVIGILTERRLLNQYMSGRVTREEFNHYSDAGEKAGGIIYIFNLYDLDLNNLSITGYIRLKDDEGASQWSKRSLPIPDAIHNRIVFSAESPVNRDMDAIRSLVPGIRIINRITSINKWNVAKILAKVPEVSCYLPQTRILKGPETTTEMLAEYDAVFLKPIRRSLGLGVIKMVRSQSDIYSAFYRHRGKNYFKEGAVESLLSDLNEVMGSRTYLVQQGITLATYQGNPFDLRVTVQKDQTGEWSVSSWGARVAAPGNIVTNVAAGGTGIPIEKVLNASFGRMTGDIMAAVNEAALGICKALDMRLQDIGDLGLDIGIDTSGRPYIIEVNFRDYRLTDVEMEDKISWALTYHKPVYYLKFLFDQYITSRKK